MDFTIIFVSNLDEQFECVKHGSLKSVEEFCEEFIKGGKFEDYIVNIGRKA